MYKSYEKSKGYQRFKKMFGGLLAKRPKIIFTGSQAEFNTPTIFLCNHGLNGSSALFVNEIYFPFKHVPIGQQEVFKNFRTRWNYLYTFNHRLRRGLGKFKSFVNATFEATFTKKFYKLCRCIPSYRDYRTRHTLMMASDCLNSGISLMIYPEQLEMGYNNIFIEYLAGFVAIVKTYLKRFQKEAKVCAVYYSKQTNQLIIDEPKSVIDLLNNGLSKCEIAKYFVGKTNSLYIDYVQPKIKEAEDKYKKKFNT